MRKNSTTLVAVVIFPAAEQFLNKCFEGIENQSDKCFDILIVEDGIKFSYNMKENKVIIRKSNDASPIENRELIINYAIEYNYDNLIFMDCDDIALSNRVKVLKKHLQNYDAVLHDMQIINEKNHLVRKFMLKDHLVNVKEVDISMLIDKNFSGLGNSGYRVSKLASSLPLPTNFQAVDWWLIINILINKGSIGYHSEVLTQYRQYNDNTANILTYDRNDIIMEFLLKQQLYCNLLIKYPGNTGISIEVKNLNKRFEAFLSNGIESKCLTRKTNIWWNLLNEYKKEK